MDDVTEMLPWGRAGDAVTHPQDPATSHFINPSLSGSAVHEDPSLGDGQTDTAGVEDVCSSLHPGLSVSSISNLPPPTLLGHLEVTVEKPGIYRVTLLHRDA